MPLYRFACSSCGREFELFLRPSEAGAGVKCPHCQADVKNSQPAQKETDQEGSSGCGSGKVT